MSCESNGLSLIKNEQLLQYGGGGFEEMHFVPTFEDRIYKEKRHASVLYVFPFLKDDTPENNHTRSTNINRPNNNTDSIKR